MSAEDLEWYRKRFESLKDLFSAGPHLTRALLRISNVGFRAGNEVILEREAELWEAALNYMQAMLEQVDALSAEGLALRKEILDFLEKHRETKGEQERQTDSGRSLGKWIEDRDGGFYLAPAALGPNEAEKPKLSKLEDHIAKKFPKTRKK